MPCSSLSSLRMGRSIIGQRKRAPGISIQQRLSILPISRSQRSPLLSTLILPRNTLRNQSFSSIVLRRKTRRAFSEQPFASSSSNTATKNRNNALKFSRSSKWALTILGVSLWGTCRSVHVITAGEVGVVECLGQVEEQLLQPGVRWVNPWARVSKFSLQKKSIHLHSQNRTKGGVFVDIDMVISYRLDPDKIKEIYLHSGHANSSNNNHNSNNSIVDHLQAKAACILQSVVARNRVDDVQKTHQLMVAQQIQKQLAEEMQKQGVMVEQVVFQKVKLPDYFTNAIQELHQLDLAIAVEKRKVQKKMVEARGMVEMHRISKAATRMNNHSHHNTHINVVRSNKNIPQRRQIQKQPQLANKSSPSTTSSLDATANTGLEKKASPKQFPASTTSSVTSQSRVGLETTQRRQSSKTSSSVGTTTASFSGGGSTNKQQQRSITKTKQTNKNEEQEDDTPLSVESSSGTTAATKAQKDKTQ
mgnify:CR=1 FL=1